MIHKLDESDQLLRAADAYIPSISASLEYLKFEGGKMLPTQFMEAEMDYFGAHGYNKPCKPGEDPGPVKKGPHHYEWKPAWAYEYFESECIQTCSLWIGMKMLSAYR